MQKFPVQKKTTAKSRENTKSYFAKIHTRKKKQTIKTKKPCACKATNNICTVHAAALSAHPSASNHPTNNCSIKIEAVGSSFFSHTLNFKKCFCSPRPKKDRCNFTVVFYLQLFFVWMLFFVVLLFV